MWRSVDGPRTSSDRRLKDQRAIEVIAERRAQNEREQQRCRFEAATPQQVAGDAEDRGEPVLERAGPADEGSLALQRSHPIVQRDDAHAQETYLVVAAHAPLLIHVDMEGVVEVGDTPDTEAVA